jgi:hypothetical protein
LRGQERRKLPAVDPLVVFPAIHEVVREVVPDARVAYVDNDPVVFDGLAGAVARTAGVRAISGDLRDPARVFQDLRAAGLDLSRPACLTFGPSSTSFPPARPAPLSGTTPGWPRRALGLMPTCRSC